MNTSKIYISPVKSLFFLLIFFLPPSGAFCQVNLKNAIYSDTELARISAYGKIWGIVNYFHPEMGKGRINSDSLFLNNLGRLASDPSSVNFTRSVSGMLTDLSDPQSKIIKSQHSEIHPVGTVRKVFGYEILPTKQLYLAFPQTAFAKKINSDSLLANSTFNDVIIDLRSSGINNDLGVKQYQQLVQPLISGIIQSTLLLPTERTFFYKGLMRQDFPQDINLFDPDKNGNVDHLQVHHGFRNISEGAYLLPGAGKKYSSKHYCFIINKFTNINSVRAVMALRNRNGCQIVVDGPVPDYLYGTFYYQKLPDGLTAKIRISEVIYEDGTLGCSPDLVIQNQSDTSINGIVITRASELLNTGISKNRQRTVENTILLRKPGINFTTPATPDVNLRLLGLFNFWNAIQYFSPNKNLISINWDSALPYFIPKFLAAETPDKYFMALMELTASIKDGHGILINKMTGRSPKGFLDGNLPFACDDIDGKVYITSIMPDTTQQAALSSLQYGDEIIAINGLSASAIIKKWEPLLVASNQSGFKRELYATWFTAGTIGSEAKITLLRSGRQIYTTLKRINRNDYYSLWGKVVRPLAAPSVFPPNCRILQGNIGYLRLNRTYTGELDSLSDMLKNCKEIIIDARGYPRDGSIGTQLATYIASKTDTVSYDEFPFVTSPDLNKRQALVEYSIIEPNTNPNLKHQHYYILVDEGDQSQAEWNIIALQGVTKAITIGRTTAGANGMAVTITLPGDYFTFFSGFGEYYMDHTPNQKNGVKIDVQVKKTLKAAINGDDDILTKAISMIDTKAHKK